MSIKVTLHGACGTVTGSCYEISNGRAAVLVDCGMFQGTKTVKALNYAPFPFAPGTIAATIATHAHIDHCGLIPRLVSHGFAGPVFATAATADLMSYVLPDSGYIQELEVARLNRRNRRRGRDTVAPIYTRTEAQACLGRIRPLEIGDWREIAPGFKARFWNAAHILGSVSVELVVQDADDDPANALRLLFSGDIGPGVTPLHGEPEAPADVDFIFMECTYGDRRRAHFTAEQRQALLAKEIAAGLARRGLILIPAFAVERTQELLADFAALFRRGVLPRVQIFLDSPLAVRATEVFSKHLNGHSGGPALAAFAGETVTFIDDAADSRKLDRLQGGAIIMAGSGMCDAGRIRHHLAAHLAQPGTTVLLVGYQAPGTLGRLLDQGQALVRIQGEEIAVAARIRHLEEYSGHADQDKLLTWLKARLPLRRDLILAHAEDAAREQFRSLAAMIVDPKRIHLPVMGETLRLTRRGAVTASVRARIASREALAADWHNTFTQTMLTLRDQLERAPDDRTRDAILARIAQATR